MPRLGRLRRGGGRRVSRSKAGRPRRSLSRRRARRGSRTLRSDSRKRSTDSFRPRKEISVSSLLTIGNRQVGPGQPVYVIAEIGINHNGDLEVARKLIDVAKIAGCDAVKFQ